jgi:chloramphenicol O-acetyltransferase
MILKVKQWIRWKILFPLKLLILNNECLLKRENHQEIEWKLKGQIMNFHKFVKKKSKPFFFFFIYKKRNVLRYHSTFSKET